jgi:hypothetical protein
MSDEEALGGDGEVEMKEGWTEEPTGAGEGEDVAMSEEPKTDFLDDAAYERDHPGKDRITVCVVGERGDLTLALNVEQTRYMTKYERARVLGTRALQLRSVVLVCAVVFAYLQHSV